MIQTNWPIIQVMLPLFVACIIALLPVVYARVLTLITLCAIVTLNVYGFLVLEGTKRYCLGGWSVPIGIEYRLDHLSQPTILCISFILLFVMIFCRQDIISRIEQHIGNKYKSIIYSMMLLLYTGFSGMVATNDLFNLYVFLEIASLSSYLFVAQGPDKRALKGALEYLILGTIGASLILISIGMIYAITGTLNIDDIRLRMQGLYQNRILIFGLCLFIIGCFFKIALFPLHFWMIKAYRYTPSVILTFLAPISTVVGFYTLVRFIYFTCDYEILYDHFNLSSIIITLSSCAIMINSYLAFKSQSIRGIILYSAAAQIGYSCLALIVSSPEILSLAASFVLADILMKMSLFVIDGDGAECHPSRAQVTSFLIFITILSNASMPLTIGFLNKVNLLLRLFEAQQYIVLVVIIGTSVLALEYNYRLFRMISLKQDVVAKLLLLNVMSFALLFMNAQLA